MEITWDCATVTLIARWPYSRDYPKGDSTVLLLVVAGHDIVTAGSSGGVRVAIRQHEGVPPVRCGLGEMNNYDNLSCQRVAR